MYMYSSRTSTDKQFLTIRYLSFPDSPLFSDCKKVEMWHLKNLFWLPRKGSPMRALSWDWHKKSAVKVANGCCNSHKGLLLKILSLKHFLIYMKRWINQHDLSVGQRKNQESLTGIEPMTWTPGGSSIHWATTTHGEQGRFTEFILYVIMGILQTARISAVD